MVIFEVVSKLNKKIRLTEIQWFHIILHHKEIKNQIEKIKETLVDPDFIFHDIKEDNYHYSKFYHKTPVTEKYMLVIVKHLNNEGFIITVFYTRKIKRV